MVSLISIKKNEKKIGWSNYTCIKMHVIWIEKGNYIFKTIRSLRFNTSYKNKERTKSKTSTHEINREKCWEERFDSLTEQLRGWFSVC